MCNVDRESQCVASLSNWDAMEGSGGDSGWATVRIRSSILWFFASMTDSEPLGGNDVRFVAGIILPVSYLPARLVTAHV